MPHLKLHFADDVDRSMKAAAAQIAAGSAFVPQEGPFSVSVLGSLHQYSAETVAEAVRSAPATLRGRFLNWDISRAKLRVNVELESTSGLLSHLQRELPRGRPWDAYYVTIGSVARIDTARHAEFMAAVNTSFPLDAELIFNLGNLELSHDAPSSATANKPKQNKPAKQAKQTPPVAPPAIKKQRARKQRHTSSPHMKWEKGTATGRSIIDQMITTASTGAATTSHARGSTASSAAGRVVKEARKVFAMRE